jgi:fructosamine-3-kinase
MPATWHELVGRALGARVVSARPLSGGDINEASLLTLDDGRSLFAKTNAAAAPAMFPAEARGLRWLAEAGALRIPRVVAVSGEEDGPSYLVLEHIGAGRRRPDFDVALGRGLAALHRFGAAQFGLDHDNFVGKLPQSNRPAATWADFYRDRRLEPRLRQAIDQGLASPRMRRDGARVLQRMEDLVGPPEPPARLHGDLWGGNLLVDEAGAPCLIDPAAYAGHREVDLAMMRLFGGFGARVFDAYAEAWPLAPGHEERVPLYQLYFLLVHVNIFGASYVSGVEDALASLV